MTDLKREDLKCIKSKIISFFNEKEENKLFVSNLILVDTTKNSFNFLGYNINNKFKFLLFPDNIKLLERFHTTGYCQTNGFPREIPRLSILRETEIINKYNYILDGLVNYYRKYVFNPKRYLCRYIYIIRYSCFKTFAQKHKSSISKILSKYKVHSNYIKKYKSNTLQIVNQEEINKKIYKKIWILKTMNQLLN